MRRSPRAPMKDPGHQFFAGAGLAGEQDGRVDGRHPLEPVQRLVQRGRVTDDGFVGLRHAWLVRVEAARPGITAIAGTVHTTSAQKQAGIYSLDSSADRRPLSRSPSANGLVRKHMAPAFKALARIVSSG